LNETALGADLDRSALAAAAHAKELLSGDDAVEILDQWCDFDDSEGTLAELITEDLIDGASAVDDVVVQEPSPLSIYGVVSRTAAAQELVIKQLQDNNKTITWSKNKALMAAAMEPMFTMAEVFDSVPDEFRRLLDRAKKLITAPAFGNVGAKRKQSAISTHFAKRDRQLEVLASLGGGGGGQTNRAAQEQLGSDTQEDQDDDDDDFEDLL